jgi:hypothetical protein
MMGAKLSKYFVFQSENEKFFLRKREYGRLRKMLAKNQINNSLHAAKDVSD